MKYYLAIDIGATSGRHILGHFENGELKIEEIYRFKTGLISQEGHCYWDISSLLYDVVEGLKVAKKLNKIPERIGIDTFGVDYVLLDKEDHPITPIFSYRDGRGNAMRDRIKEDNFLFQQTGIQPNGYNTIFQLFDDYKIGRLQKASTLLMLPSFIAFYLTGVKQNEISILSTSGLYDVSSLSFSKSILRKLQIDESFFGYIIPSGTKISSIKEEICREIGYSCDVYASLEHDTASSFFGSRATEEQILLSSGTWSLLGALLPSPIINKEVLDSKFSNEIGYHNQIRFLQNITGMWLINQVLEEENKAISIVDAVNLAEASSSYQGIFDIDDQGLTSPEHISQKIRMLLKLNGYESPKTNGELYYAIFHSMAFTYKIAINRLKALTKRDYSQICIFGGGSKNLLLNRLIEEQTGLKVTTGPVESTAIGNILSIIEK